MAHPRRLFGRLAAVALSVAMAASITSVASADPGDEAPQFAHKHSQIARSTGAAPATSLRPAASETGNAMALVNGYRARVGLAALRYDSSLDAALRAHANYLQLNVARADLDPYEEVPGLPGYTQAGAEVAQWISVTFQSPNYSAGIDLLLMDPWERTARFLHPDATGFAVTRTTDFTVYLLSYGQVATSPAFSFPSGPGYTKLAFESSVAPAYTGECSQSSTAWGYPVTAQFDYREFESIKGVSTSLFRDGAPISYCLLSTGDQTGLKANATLIPTSPLVQGSHYTGTVTATGVRADGSTAALKQTIDFTTAAPVTGVAGDQTGDSVADILAVTSQGNLRIYKGIRPGTVGHGWQVGPGWGSFTWVAHTPDVNGDRREDLLGRRSDGKLFLFLGQGMGSYTSARQVGTGWGGLKNLTVVGDMIGNGQTHVVGIGADGALYRYTLTSSGMAGASKIGTGWTGMAHLASVGSFNKADTTADVIAVGKDGNLYAYYTRGGNIIQAAKVGQGWNGWTALFSPGDLSGDGRPDLMGRKPTGELFSYTNNQGSWGYARKAGNGWNGMTLFG